MSQHEYFMFPTSFRVQLKGIYFPLSVAHRISDSKISGAIPSKKRFLEWASSSSSSSSSS